MPLPQPRLAPVWEPAELSPNWPPRLYLYAALENGRIAAVGVAAGIASASFASGAGPGIVLGIGSDAMFDASCIAEIDSFAYLWLTLGSAWPSSIWTE